MLKKQCPWCDKKITVNGLGTRPIDKDLKWYQFSQNEKVCPYCAKPVTLGGKIAKLFLLLIVPLFILIFIELLTNSNVGSYDYLEEVSWSLSIVGIIGFLVFFRFEKVQ